MPRLSRSLIHYELFPKHLRFLFYADVLRGIADSALGIFMPLFLFEQGGKIAYLPFHASSFLAGILLVTLYYGFQRLFILLLALPLSRVIRLSGYRWSLIFGNLLRGTTLVFLQLARHDLRLLAFALMAGAADDILNGVSHDCVFASEARYDQMGRDVGALAFLTKLIQIAVPAAAGLIVLLSGYSTLFSIGIACVVASCIPILFVPVKRVTKIPTLKELFLWLRERRFLRFCIAVAGKYMDIIAILLWPIYVLAIVGKIQRVGYVYSIVLFISLVLTYVVGWYMDHHKHKKLFIGSGVLLSILWILRTFVHEVGDIILVDTVDKLLSSVNGPCYDAYMFERSKGHNVLAFTIYREMLYSAFALLLWMVVAVAFLLPFNWGFVFVLGAFGMTLSLLLDGRIQ